MVRNEKAIKQNQEVFRERIQQLIKTSIQDLVITVNLIRINGGTVEDCLVLTDIAKEELEKSISVLEELV